VIGEAGNVLFEDLARTAMQDAQYVDWQRPSRPLWPPMSEAPHPFGVTVEQ
jgi:hypothetical protein